MVLATVTGVLIGVLTYRSELAGDLATATTATILTVPSLALIGLLIPVVGLGVAPTVIALTVYGLLPIVRNASVGLRGVDPAPVAAAKSIGMARVARERPQEVSLCVEGEFAAREDGMRGVFQTYDMSVPVSRISKMSSGVVYTQVAGGKSCTFGEIFTTDGRVRAMDLRVLEDDRHFFPQYDAAPVVHSSTLEKHPEIADVVAPLTRALDNDVARELNARVDVDGEDPHDVARDWLVEEGFITEN